MIAIVNLIQQDYYIVMNLSQWDNLIVIAVVNLRQCDFRSEIAIVKLKQIGSACTSRIKFPIQWHFPSNHHHHRVVLLRHGGGMRMDWILVRIYMQNEGYSAGQSIYTKDVIVYMNGNILKS